jgi:hypothetical protein
MAKTLIKQTEPEEVWKFVGTTLNDTVALATDCLSPTMVIQGTPTANIRGMIWSSSVGTTDAFTITRNSVVVLKLSGSGKMELNGFTDTTNNTSDIVVTSVGSGTLYLTIKKIAGYKSKIEPEFYGQYDNTTVTGG